MQVKELEAKISLLELIERNHKVKKAGKALRVEPCPVCTHKDHFTIYPETNSYTSFAGCCSGGSVYKYLQEVEGMNKEVAFAELHRLAGETMVEYKNKASSPTPTKANEEAAKKLDYTAEINTLYQKQTGKDRSYFLNRGVKEALIEKYKLCISEDGKQAILPIWKGDKVVSYTTRAIDEAQEPKYKNSVGESGIFNIDYLSHAKVGEVIVICEGMFDALTLEGVGIKAVALGGVNHFNKLIKAMETAAVAKGIIFLTAFDNDEAGKQATQTAIETGCKPLIIPKEYKDINEWALDKDAMTENEEFEAEVKTQINAMAEDAAEKIAQQTKPDAVSHYLGKVFVEDIERFKTYKDKKTGFSNLDYNLGGLYTGLYVVGGISSVGKTTFIHQLGDQLAEQGDHVLYFSLEQSKFELVSKSLARIVAKQYGTNTGIRNIDIRSGHKSDKLRKAVEAYESTSERVSVIEGNFNTNIETMKLIVEKYINGNGVKPIVIIDYLQIIPAADKNMTDKQKVDYNVTELKRLSRDLDLTVFVISSLNRGNYATTVDFESFKESGGIEYTADVVWGLQLAIVSSDTLATTKGLTAKRDLINKAKDEIPRKIELVSLKNRNGQTYFKCNFDYYAACDLYEVSKWQG